MGDNKHVKSIVNTAHVNATVPSWSPHHFEYNTGHFAVNTQQEIVPGPFNSPPLYDVM